jgi:hypothetical protein
MNCIQCNRTAQASCRFCGRAVCKDHLMTKPYIVSLYLGKDGINKAIIVSDAVYCGSCKPNERPVPLPDLV